MRFLNFYKDFPQRILRTIQRFRSPPTRTRHSCECSFGPHIPAPATGPLYSTLWNSLVSVEPCIALPANADRVLLLGWVFEEMAWGKVRHPELSAMLISLDLDEITQDINGARTELRLQWCGLIEIATGGCILTQLKQLAKSLNSCELLRIRLDGNPRPGWPNSHGGRRKEIADRLNALL
ncbi:MAG: hypothetical protein U0936_18560 [Planctomycetaceae bacterium]